MDGDVLAYESAFAAEAAWKYDFPSSLDPPPFDKVAEQLDNRLANICGRVGATQPPILYLTGKKNFRHDIAKRQAYKDRASNKPWHFKNVLAYMKGKYDCRLTEGLEADDLMSIEQTRSRELLEGNPLYTGPTTTTIICTRDKDLRSVEGWHYGWELENQPEFGPEIVDFLGRIRLSDKRNKIIGTGLLFFYAQCLTGDSVDSIVGLPKCGPVKAYETLKSATSEEEAFRSVLSAYKASYGDEQGPVELLEQGRLLWMTRYLHEDGSPVLWELPYE